MEIIADLQIHSKYARATSKDISIENLEKYARMKGLNLLGVGDFQHPLRRKEIDDKLTEDENGILRTANGFPFLWQTEVSLMFSQGGKRRAVHLLVFAPNTNIADAITSYLGSKGRLDYDGRPIFGISCENFVKEIKEIDDKIEIIPAHCLLPNEKIICNPDVKPISQIKKGDKVLTHTGNYKLVSNTFIKDYEGKIYYIQPYYFREGINVTSEHPFLAIKTVKNCPAVGGLCKPNSTAKGKHICREKHYQNYNPMWIPAKKLEVNDVLLYPRPREVKDTDKIKISDLIKKSKFVVKNGLIYPIIGRQDKGIRNNIKITPDFCRLIGYYLAEGYIIKKNNCVQFSFGKHEEDYIDDVVKLMNDCFGVKLSKKRERNGFELYFYSKVLVDLFEEWFYGENNPLRAFSKKIPGFIMYLPINKQAELFRGWWRGDAGVTTSEILAQQMKLICLRLGIIPSIFKITKEQQSKYNKKIKDRIITANHDCLYLQNLSFYEDKFNLLEEKEFIKFKTKLQRKHGWIDDNFVYIPIKEININNYEGEVYNLEVEDDNSYVTTSATVHNCMTPWFGIFGSDSGFDSLKECFQTQTKHIYAVESGMSADPSMLWRLDEDVNIVSFSDAHSHWPWRLGREATIFEFDELSYDNFIKAIRTGQGLKSTIETPPEYGKYHWDGHRNCEFSSSPEETKKLNGICPVCKKKMTIGVEYRIESISKFPQGHKNQKSRHFYKLLPLHEVLALHFNVKDVQNKKVWEVYNLLIKEFGNEFNILLNVSTQDFINKGIDAKVIDLILRNREEIIKVKPGFDGEYGKALMAEKQVTL